LALCAAAALLLGAGAAQARDSWFEEACQAAERQGRYHIEVQQGDEVIQIDCIGEIIEIDDEGDDGPSLPGGSTKPGGGGDPGGEGGPSGGGGSGSPYGDPCAACAQTADECRAKAHAFRKACMGAGFRFASEQCSGWGDFDEPRNCDGSPVVDVGELLSTARKRTDRCLIISFDRNRKRLAKEVCEGDGTKKCIDDCMHGTGGGGGGNFSILGTGFGYNVQVPVTDGINKACTQTASTVGTDCGTAEAACRREHSCDGNTLRRGAASGRTLAERVGGVSTQRAGDAIRAETLSETELRKLGAQHWLADYLGEAYLGRTNEQRFLALIGEATARYLAVYHAQQPGRAPAASGAAAGGGASGQPSTPSKTMSGVLYSYQKQTTARAPAVHERAPDPGPRFEDAKSLAKVDEVFLRKAFLFLTPQQEELLLDSWPGGALVFGSGIVRR
jgi:hypothetical protein